MTRGWQGPLDAVRTMAEQTPRHRNRHVDLMRAAAIGAVVLGHWLMMVVEYGPQGLHGTSALADLTWGHPVTWVFQVMPIVFFVGGYANAASLSSHLDRGGDSSAWLAGRGARLLAPTTLLLGVFVACAGAAVLLGVDPELTALAVWAAAMPLWFLAAYLGMVLLAPLTFRLHRRLGLGAVLGLVAVVAALDVVQYAEVAGPLPETKYLIAWLAVHQAGYCWYDRLLPTRPWATALLAGGGLAVAVALTVLGPYPVSMVTVPGVEASHAEPPTVPLLALAAAQVGLILLLWGPSERWLRRSGVWRVVVGANAVVFTVFLWHMSAAVIGAALLYPTGVLPQPPVDSAQWLLLRLPWLACLAVILAVLVGLFGRFEVRAGGVDSGGHLTMPARWLVPAGMAACILALVLIALSGPVVYSALGLPLVPYALYFLGAVLVRWARR